ncbi:glycosyltransferase family 2 protein [Roseinatronobacter bogoriensis]|uniref:Glycosyltransferase family 2 protein n=1 Tax=Roseinatronobacter bogoriensis subsp. barguzinensis TaxID=441209 RepID=A0A2K8KGK9_9RHOB|nr:MULTISPECIES: glycosyltransferase family 2 protein [Rhodobaca]ATX67123.1 glycosyltransferase family 2 protein [Rhodobaca barguzinensis]MBB4206641.1 succinoglycan biosynthesis protein ExoA [Rhodobaca bogoriensis DSM 18756]TDW41385.1 succinoglycan biosynthesis protein ExoA [Rhodobaca barguzinensis]TDY74437.1 succinoglycan biosynthesis protein ExoA [Rhodobaca bogoriensis DSM 18756]
MTVPSCQSCDRLLIVIPTLNEADHIQGVIQSLLHDAPPSTILVVADGGSTDGTPTLVRQMDDPRIRFIENPHRIQSAAINLAVAAFGEGATHLLRADAHALYPRGFVRALLEDMRATDATAVTVAMTTLADQGFVAGVAAAQNSRLGTGGAAHRMGKGGRFIDHGHHALIRMDAFRDIGGYDARQSHNEDAEFDHRLTRNGGRIWLSGRTQMGYFPRQTAKALFLQYFRFGAGRAQTLLKHDLLPRPRQFLPLLVAPSVGLAVVGLAGLMLAPAWGWLALIVPAGLWAALCLGYGSALAWDARRAAVLWAGPAAMLMHLGWSAGFLRQLASHLGGQRLWSAVRNQ